MKNKQLKTAIKRSFITIFTPRKDRKCPQRDIIKCKWRNKMKVKKVPCRMIRFREFPELLFGASPDDGPVYFDATHFIRSKGDERRHNVQEFRIAFHHWITALSDMYSIDKEDLVICEETSGHLLIDECLALLFVVYIDPAFGAYMLERVSELLIDGFTVSDSWLVMAAGNRFTLEELTKNLKSNET